MKDIRSTIAKMASDALRLRIDTSAELRDWLDGCSGQTMTHLDLYRAKREIDWACENLSKIKAEVDAACALADQHTGQAA